MVKSKWRLAKLFNNRIHFENNGNLDSLYGQGLDNKINKKGHLSFISALAYLCPFCLIFNSLHIN